MTTPSRASTETWSGAFARIDKETVLVDLVLLGTAAFMYVQASTLSATARRAPIWILTAMVALILLDLAITIQHAVTDRTHLDEHGDSINEPVRVQLTFLAALVICGLLMYQFGYRVATPVFLTGFMLAMRVPLKQLVPYVAGYSLFIYVIFSELLNVR